MPQQINQGWGDQGRHFDWNYGSWLDQAREREGTALAKMPYDLLGELNKVRQEGIYGQQGRNAIGREFSNAAAFERRKLADALRRTLSRRLGPRSGAAANVVADRAYAPSVSQAAGMRANLLREDYQASANSLNQMFQVMQFLQKRYGEKWWEAADDDGGGLLGTLVTLAQLGGDIAGTVAGIPGAGSAAKSVFQAVTGGGGGGDRVRVGSGEGGTYENYQPGYYY